MDLETMFYVFGPIVGYAVGAGLAALCYSYAIHKGRIR